MGHSHSHHHPDLKGRNLLVSIFLNSIITAAQIVGGVLSGSLALLSDALHNFTDVLSLIISYIANVLSGRKASAKRTFGYKRAELIAAFVNAATLVVISILLVIESVKRFINPQEIESDLVILLSLLGIIVNGFSVLMLRKDAGKNINIRSAYLHLLTDMMASMAVLIGGLLMKFYKVYWIDSVLTLLIGIYLIYVGYALLKKSAGMLMLFTPEHIAVDEIAETIHRIPRVNRFYHIHVWCLNDGEYHLEAHLDLKEDVTLSEFAVILSEIETILHNTFHIHHINIQPEFNKNTKKDLIVQH